MILTVIVQVLLIFRLRSRGRSSFDWSVSMILAGDFIGIIDWSWARRRFSWILNYRWIQGQIKVKSRSNLGHSEVTNRDKMVSKTHTFTNWRWICSKFELLAGSGGELIGLELVENDEIWETRDINSLKYLLLTFVNILSTFSQHFLNILSIFCQYFVNILSSFCQHFVNVLSTFCQHLVNILSTCCQHLVNILSTFVNNFSLPIIHLGL